MTKAHLRRSVELHDHLDDALGRVEEANGL